MSNATDRTAGLVGDFGIKTPVACASTTNVVLSGEQTIDGVLTSSSRVLLLGQTDNTTNGIYDSDTGTWTRSQDCDGPRDLRRGTLINVTDGTANAGYWYCSNATNPVTPDGTMAISFAMSSTTLAVVSAFVQTLLNKTSASAFLTALGFSAFFQTLIVAASDVVLRGLLGIGTLGTKNTVGAVDLSTAVVSQMPMLNGTFTHAMSGNALTIALKTLAGADPSATDPVYFVFRDATAATGDYVVLSVTAALSLVVSSGSTLGTSSAVAARIYVVAFNDAGTVRLGVYNPLSGTVAAGFSLIGIQDDQLYSSTAEGGVGGADSTQVIYTGAAVNSKALRVVEYFEATQAAAGTWVTPVSKSQLMGPGVRRTGDELPSVRSINSALITPVAITPLDDTQPTNAEGTQVTTVAYSALSAINIIELTGKMFGSFSGTGNSAIESLHVGTADAIAANFSGNSATAASVNMSVTKQVLAGTTASVTYQLRAGITGGTFFLNGLSAGGRAFGGFSDTGLYLKEIMV